MRLRRRRHGFHSAPPPRRGRFKAERRFRADGRRHPWLRRTLIAAAALVLLVVLAGGAGWFYVRYRLDNVPRFSIAAGLLAPQHAGAAYDVLLVESRGVDGPADLVAVARVEPATRTVELLAIPASLRVPPAGSRKGTPPAPLLGSLSPASDGGLSLLVRNVETSLHVPVSHVAEVDTAGLQALVDHLGGVYLDFPAPLEDQSTGLKLDSTGCQSVGGTQAVTLVASASPYWYQHGQWQQWSGGDLTTVPVELAVLAGLLVRAAPSFGNPVGLNDLVGAGAGAVRIDSTWSAGALMSDAGQLAGVTPSSITAETVPTAAAGTYRVTSPATAAAISAFLAGHMAPAAAAAAPWLPRPCAP